MLLDVSRAYASLLSCVLLALLVLTAWTDEIVLVCAAVLLVQVLVAAAPGAADERGRIVRGPRLAPALVAGVVSTLVAARPDVLAGADGQRASQITFVQSGVLVGVLPAVAAAVFVALVAQMLRSDGRPRLVLSTGLAVSLAVVAALGSGWVSAVRATGGPDVVTVVACAAGLALLVWNLPGDRVVVAGAAVLAGAVAGALVPLLLDDLLTPWFGLVVGPVAAVVAVLGQVLGRGWSRGRLHAAEGWGFPAAAAVALVGPVAHLAGQLATAPFA
ncbi:hypothetical protein ASD11_01570 [Aeromicrobium sp. Root495]|nr:hypothetical protein ASD11_01570 [Aeromicrobium sp. Root495]